MCVTPRCGDRRGISPVIATVILVAVAITVAVAVAYWMSGIAGQYTSFEKMEIRAHYSKYTDDLSGDGVTTDDPGWKEYIELKNSGSKDGTIINVFLNNIPLSEYTVVPVPDLFVSDDSGGPPGETLSAISIPVPKGADVMLILWLPEDTEGCSSGTTIDIKIATAAGNKFPILEQLQ